MEFIVWKCNWKRRVLHYTYYLRAEKIGNFNIGENHIVSEQVLYTGRRRLRNWFHKSI